MNRSARSEGEALLRLALPIMLIALVNMGMSITDTVMVSVYFGADALAAVAVGSDLQSIVFYLGAGILGGPLPSTPPPWRAGTTGNACAWIASAGHW